MHKNSFEGMFLERVFSEAEVQDAVHNDCSSVLCSLRGLCSPPAPMAPVLKDRIMLVFLLEALP